MTVRDPDGRLLRLEAPLGERERMTATSNMAGLERIVSRLPEAERVDIAEWGDHPTFRVRGKNFIFCDAEAVHLSVKLPAAEAAAVIATDPRAEPAGYGLGRHGWIAITLSSKPDRRGWREIEEWVRTSYTLVAPKTLARIVLEADAHQLLPDDGDDKHDQPGRREASAGEHLGLAPESVADRHRLPRPCARPESVTVDPGRGRGVESHGSPGVVFESKARSDLGCGDMSERHGGGPTPPRRGPRDERGRARHAPLLPFFER